MDSSGAPDARRWAAVIREPDMINIEGYISDELQQTSKEFKILEGGEYISTDCKYWLLSPPTNEDKSLDQLDYELTKKLYELYEDDPDSPEIPVIVEKHNKLLEGVKITKKYGYSLYTPNDLLIKDKHKGIRKEWWKYKQLALENGSRLFLGYESPESLAMKIADKLILMPGIDQYRYLEIHKTSGNNYPIETNMVIRRLKHIEEEVDLEIVSATYDSVEILLKYSENGVNTNRMRYQLRKLCPDIEDLSSSLKLGRIHIWWD